MIYRFNCEVCGEIEIKESPNNIKEIMTCPQCNSQAKRIYSPLISTWNCDGNYGKSTDGK